MKLTIGSCGDRGSVRTRIRLVSISGSIALRSGVGIVFPIAGASLRNRRGRARPRGIDETGRGEPRYPVDDVDLAAPALDRFALDAVLAVLRSVDMYVGPH